MSSVSGAAYLSTRTAAVPPRILGLAPSHVNHPTSAARGRRGGHAEHQSHPPNDTCGVYLAARSPEAVPRDSHGSTRESCVYAVHKAFTLCALWSPRSVVLPPLLAAAFCFESAAAMGNQTSKHRHRRSEGEQRRHDPHAASTSAASDKRASRTPQPVPYPSYATSASASTPTVAGTVQSMQTTTSARAVEQEEQPPRFPVAPAPPWSSGAPVQVSSDGIDGLPVWVSPVAALRSFRLFAHNHNLPLSPFPHILLELVVSECADDAYACAVNRSLPGESRLKAEREHGHEG